MNVTACWSFVYYVQQIVKILTLYTPHSDLDERVTLNFIRTVQVQSPQLLDLVCLLTKNNVSHLSLLCLCFPRGFSKAALTVSLHSS